MAETILLHGAIPHVPGFRGRVYAFGEDEAACYGRLVAGREAAGLHVDAVDMMIAPSRREPVRLW